MNSPSPLFSQPAFILVGKSPEFERIAIGGVQQAFPNARIEAVDSLEEAAHLAESLVSISVVLLLMGEAARASAAFEALDETRLPRWAVVAFGGVDVPDEVVAVMRPDEDPRLVARSIRLALAVYRLRRENLERRGDLQTIGTRIAHDLRSPLGGVLTSVEVLKEVLGDEAPEQVALLDPIMESVDGLTKLVRLLSLLTKATGGTNPQQRFNMSLPFWAAFQRVEQAALASDATIVQPGSWPDAEGDPAWAEMIWHALLSNSLQFGGPTPRIEAGWTRRDGENRFWVIDAGIVPPAKRPALFTPFHLLHQANAPRGLGLPLVRRLAELQGGKSGYESTPEGGSCFFFTLPIQEREP